MKDDLDKTGMKKQIKMAKNCMHWDVALDALPGLYVFWTAGVTTDYSSYWCHGLYLGESQQAQCTIPQQP